MRVEERRAIDAEGCKLLHRELDEDLLVLRAQDLDLRNVGHPEELRADVLDIVAKLAMGEAVGGESVDDPEGVAELVVETRADDAGRQRMADVADALANVVPDIGNLTRRRAAFQIDEDGRDAGARVAAQEIELRRFLQLALKPLGDLLQGVFDGGARPGGLHDHGLDDERGVLAAPQPEIRHEPRGDRDNHEVGDERAVPECPFRKIEPRHGCDPSRRIFWPGCKACTPAVTTISPAPALRKRRPCRGHSAPRRRPRIDTVRSRCIDDPDRRFRDCPSQGRSQESR